MNMQITVRYRSIDGAKETRKFKTIEGARAYAAKLVGEAPEMGARYAVSGDGIGKVTVDGATLGDLFPETKTPTKWTVADYVDTGGQGLLYRVQCGNEVWGHYQTLSEAKEAEFYANSRDA